MKNLRALFVALIFICSNNLFSQPPGYLGKRASINFNLSSSPALIGPTQNNRGEADKTLGEGAGWLGINYEFSVDFSYVLGRHRSISLLVGQYYTGLKMNATTTPIALELISGGNASSNALDRHELLYRVNVRSVGIIYSKFKNERGALAPIGNRFYIGLKRNFANASVIDKRTDFYDSTFGNQFGHNNLNIDENKSFHYLLLGWSNNMVFWDQVIFKTGFRLGLPLDYGFYKYITNDTEDVTPEYNTNPNQFEYEADLFKRLAWHEFLRVELGIGYLLF